MLMNLSTTQSADSNSWCSEVTDRVNSMGLPDQPLMNMVTQEYEALLTGMKEKHLLTLSTLGLNQVICSENSFLLCLKKD
jgi:hypothetical protein